MPGGKRKMGGDKRCGAEIAAGGFQLADGIPGRIRWITDANAIVMTEKQRFDLFSAGGVAVAIIGKGKRRTQV
jgi:hypothetical protein